MLFDFRSASGGYNVLSFNNIGGTPSLLYTLLHKALVNQLSGHRLVDLVVICSGSITAAVAVGVPLKAQLPNPKLPISFHGMWVAGALF